MRAYNRSEAASSKNREVLEVAGAEVFADVMKARREARRQAQAERHAELVQALVTDAILLIQPCPWCGEPGQYSRDGVIHEVGCVNVDCPVKPTVEMEHKNTTALQLVSAWNTRFDCE